MQIGKIAYSRVTVAPTAEPITRDDAKLQCRLELDYTDEDDLIDALITTGRELAESFTNRSFITQTRVVKFDSFPLFGNEIKLPNGLVQEVSSVKYYDTTDAEQTMNAALYWTDVHSEIARVVTKDDWPDTYDRPNAVSVEYIAGYGDSASDVPNSIKVAIKIIVAALYQHRGDEPFEIPELAKSILERHIIEHNAWY